MIWKNEFMPGARVLVVDDDAVFIRRAMVSLGQAADVKSVASGEDLLRRVYNWLPDVVLLNMLLDDRDGFQMLEEILDVELDHRPFVFCTTSGPSSINRLSDRPDWPVGTISRSTRLEQLRDTINSALAARESVRDVLDSESQLSIAASTIAG